ncbi:stress responsive alpha/beta barrel protein [Rhizobium sp. PP-F2F-G48]|uniref:Dabb family protein n=1 Tax=Rhizobium sp. PP-F2F-G48 TaxID=2135651 RepID=UPI001052AE32|nr:Dabb family protein [Rhizobium sp. PP-F2F-G48]TCM50734.1 stress responsive alpha/beta barrel protein [Rhizobium sp. PP-F2F-G48]
MIKHIVMWDVRGETAEEKLSTAAVVKAKFEALAGIIPGLRTLEIGIDISRISYACDVVLYSEFDSIDALNSYADHPEHQRVKAELEGLRIARHQVDYRVGPTQTPTDP